MSERMCTALSVTFQKDWAAARNVTCDQCSWATNKRSHILGLKQRSLDDSPLGPLVKSLLTPTTSKQLS